MRVPIGTARLRTPSSPTAAPDAEPWPAARWYRIANRRCGKGLGVDGMPTANSAHVVQFGDTGTAGPPGRLLRDPVPLTAPPGAGVFR